nr:immunoglobulin light chain junction region [Macaca mulatta]MOV61166.1 immunoglobulin light chain junction region [Macaca mulatta]MOV61886.1 immunoglobulin light chain junction region [Macaca mulatta]MOV62586.1 immunoglobulin light chain junction region [Macaca mulatta]MOV62733.1 immunoglobulin light chain junction region [Macaca mulatta]
CYQHSSGYSF